ncbi:transcription antitermination factor NusB [Phenylobacterium sp.]|uniref:transcription antitermination factor NusB n=1 Tax=Phenylobacterium sp. TaxID=1871053 RepID=UPI0008B36DF6|nr:transcription antitermination factor NusB [Phenylobacterium sp.]MBA4792790.1 transcription antitermination factor NusB [Phenylobacterium sp.]MBC7165831.1 transcription antitermination factor NusB [Phenylobacterium sp.]OHB32857.1 MAG: transcription antitermination factor NusB [Phenylobacterium sp. RIFCSPHIGHO2_01_FULL_70_10]
MSAETPKPPRPTRQARSTARLAVVQALYQMEVSGVGVEAVIREFSDHRFDRDVEGFQLSGADEVFFGELLRGVVSRQAEIDRMIVRRLAQGWRLERLDATVRAILRAGVYELAERSDVPTEVAIDEYVELAKSFFEGPEPGFVNGALDGVAQDVRG